MNIRIFTRPNTKVGYKHAVTGRCNGHVQVFILSGDGKYYLQPPPVFRGNKFLVDCKFGFEDIGVDSAYEVCCVNTELRPHSPLTTLPAGDKSTIIVWRSKC